MSSKNANVEKEKSRAQLQMLMWFSLLSSMLPAAMVFMGKFTTIVELYVAFLVYTLILLFFGYLFFLRYETKFKREMKALVKKEGIISGELVLINTEEKLKNVLSLEFERCSINESESSIIFFDIDHLGEINRKYGYNAGDQVIIEIILSTKRFVSDSETLQKTGAIIARVKGDTFALLMPNITEKRAYNEAEKLKHMVETLRLGIDEAITCRFAVLSMNHWVSEEKFLDLAYEKLKLAKDYGQGVII
jgi:diguanylate cyclase (GGDEF)-like protein